MMAWLRRWITMRRTRKKLSWTFRKCRNEITSRRLFLTVRFASWWKRMDLSLKIHLRIRKKERPMRRSMMMRTRRLSRCFWIKDIRFIHPLIWRNRKNCKRQSIIICPDLRIKRQTEPTKCRVQQYVSIIRPDVLLRWWADEARRQKDFP